MAATKRICFRHRGLFRDIFHPLLGEGGPNEISGQPLQGSFFAGQDRLPAEDIEPRVSPAVHHSDEIPGDLLLAQEHGKHVEAEELFQVFRVEFRSAPENFQKFVWP